MVDILRSLVLGLLFNKVDLLGPDSKPERPLENPFQETQAARPVNKGTHPKGQRIILHY
jgi:hypothetical protein